MLSLTSSRTHQKIHLKWSTLSENYQKTGRKAFHNQACEERYAGSTVEREERRTGSGPMVLVGHRRGRAVTDSESSLAREGLITQIGHVSPGVQHPKDEF